MGASVDRGPSRAFLVRPFLSRRDSGARKSGWALRVLESPDEDSYGEGWCRPLTVPAGLGEFLGPPPHYTSLAGHTAPGVAVFSVDGVSTSRVEFFSGSRGVQE